MSNPNTNALKLAARQSSNSSSHVVHVGKYARPVTLPVMSSVNSRSWKRSASFNCLRISVYDLAGSHPVADTISLVSDELPLDTWAAFQEAQLVVQTVIEHVTLIQNLEPLAFLTSTGKIVHIDDVNNLASRPEDITFIKVHSVVEVTHVDTRVRKGSILSVNFCLRLPQYIYDMINKTATIIKVSSILVPNATSDTSASLTQAFQTVSTPHSTSINNC